MPDAPPLAHATGRSPAGADRGRTGRSASTPGSRPACTTLTAASTRAARGSARTARSRPRRRCTRRSRPPSRPRRRRPAPSGCSRPVPATARWPRRWSAAGLEVVLLERAGGHARAAARAARRHGHAGSATSAEAAPFNGLIVANELLDALPVPAVRRRRRGAASASTRTAGSRRCPAPPPRARRTIERPALRAVAARPRGRRCAAAACCSIDYAAVPGDPRDPVRTYIGGQHGGDPLQAPGTQDLTADVDFAEVRAVLAAAGLARRRRRAAGRRGCAATASSCRRSRAAPTTAGGWRACSTRRCRSTCWSPSALTCRTHEGPGDCRAPRRTNVGVER